MNYDCVILGAGIAGLSAARMLAASGRSVLVLEAQSQVGGRMRTRHVAGLSQPIELGAEFIHGRPPALLALLSEAGLAIEEAEGEELCYESSRIEACRKNDAFWEILHTMQQTAAREGDMSVDEFLQHLDQDAAPPEARTRMRNYVEGFNAADAAVLGIAGLARQQIAEDAIEGERAARVTHGYQALAEYVRDRAVAAGAVLQLQQTITAVAWHPGLVTVHTQAGQSWTACRLLCTLPLGVLQSGAVDFDPLPGAILSIASDLRAGIAHRVVLQFEHAWWQSTYPHMRFLFAPDQILPTWWTTAPVTSPLLTGWVGGPRAHQFTSHVTSHVTSHGTSHAESSIPLAVQMLETAFDRSIQALLVAAHHHDWQNDPLFRGAYSYAPARAAGSAELLTHPLASTLFFAGEHTDTTGHPGTVHGALGSGLRAARQILNSF
jgi:monoamine oxidase